MDDIVISAEKLGKKYEIPAHQENPDTLRDTIANFVAAPFRRDKDESWEPYFWALKDVSFEIKRGEVVGVIGRNGAGKSTLLKILSRITEPTEGIAEIRGRVGSLLEVGTGFHPELSGRENIFLSGAILGMTREAILRNFDEIVAFSEVEKFIDTPVKHYSSGMYVRLAFAVAAHFEPEILLIDEVLAVGDASFQKKCLGKMDDVANEGKTIILVSHNMASIQNLCSRSILLEKGMVAKNGTTDDVIEAYLSVLQGHQSSDISTRQDREGNGQLRWKSVSFYRKNGEPSTIFLSGEDLLVCLQYDVREFPLQGNTIASISFKDRYGQVLFLCSSEFTNQLKGSWPDRGTITCKIPRLPLTSGTYSINVYAAVNGTIADWVRDAGSFQVQNADFFETGKLPPSTHGNFLVSHSWDLKEVERVPSNSGERNN